MLFSVFCGVSLFDILLIISAVSMYIKNKILSKKIEKQLKECNMTFTKEGQILESDKVGDNNAW